MGITSAIVGAGLGLFQNQQQRRAQSKNLALQKQGIADATSERKKAMRAGLSQQEQPDTMTSILNDMLEQPANSTLLTDNSQADVTRLQRQSLLGG